MLTKPLCLSPRLQWIARALALGIVLTLSAATLILLAILHETTLTYQAQFRNHTAATNTPPFPLGIDPEQQIIVEQTDVELYLQNHFAGEFKRTEKVTWLDALYRKVATLPLYQSLASPNTRILVIFAGERKEEIAYNFGRILGWDKAERAQFIELVSGGDPLAEGMFYPGRYVVSADATPAAVSARLREEFTTAVLDRYPHSHQAVLPLTEALTIASLIEREANTFSDMREISGVIWNRLFADMKLQLDASLQYARGSRSWEPQWWPVPRPSDKFIDSPYNTYQNEGLPPGPIANPSAAAIIAALNPVETTCFYYFHHKRDLYCSDTYEEHVTKLKNIYGRGR